MERAVFRFGDWEVDPAARSIARDACRRQMDPRAMDVLVALCRRAKLVVSAEELLQLCWGSVINSDNQVHKIITQLRSLLGDNVKAPVYIETIRKRGYRTIAEVAFPERAQDGADAVSEAWREQSPFRGLQAFDETCVDVFFGRAEAVTALRRAVDAQTLAGCDLTLVLGPSGSGKTSLVRAGLLPALMRSDPALDELAGIFALSAATFDLAEIGEHAVLTALASVMLDWQLDGGDVFPGASGASLGQRLTHDFASVTEDLRRALATAEVARSSQATRLVLFVDRFEAIFVAPQWSEAQRLEFVHLLDALASTGLVAVIVACRNDFYPHIASYPALMRGKARGAHFDLAPPSPAELAQIIRRPAQLAGLSFGVDTASQTRLDDVLCADAAGQPDVLPLLQYTLHELYRLRAANGELSFEAFHQLGGIDGAIAHRAEVLLHALGEAHRAALPRILSLVAAVSENDELISSRRAPWSALHSEAERELVGALVEARLFVSQLVDDAPGFGVAHEALLRRWPRVTAWIEEHRHALRVRGRIATLAARWVEEGRSADLLLPPGKQLDEAQSLIDDAVLSLAPEQIALIHSSRHKLRRRERLRLTILAAMISLSLLAAGLGVNAVGANRVAQQRRAEAEGLMGFMLGDFADKLRPIGRLDLLDDISAKALQYLSASNNDKLDATSLTQRAKALQTIAEVRVARGNSPAAMEALADAQAILLRQLAGAPGDKDILKNLGANAFWQGQIQLNRSDWNAAEQSFTAYRDYADRLFAADPANTDAWIEQSYAHTNLGVLAFRRGDPGRAAPEFQASVYLKTKAAARKPQDRSLEAELANSLSWLAKCEEALGNLGRAAQFYEREVQIVTALHESAPDEALWSSRTATGLEHRARLEDARGDDLAALADYTRAEQLFDRVTKQEPTDKDRQGDLVFIRLEKLRLLMKQGEAKEVLPAVFALSKEAAALTKLDPKKMDWLHLRALIDQSIAESLLKLGRASEALPYMTTSLRLFEALYKRNDADSLTREYFARALLVNADIAFALNNKNEAYQACQQAGALIEADVAHTSDYRSLDPWARSRLCLGEIVEANKAEARLAEIGYRESGYISSISKTKP